MNFSVVEPYASMFWGGLAGTLEVTGAALVLAFALGAVIAVLKVLPCRPLRLLLDFYTSIFRGIPLIVLLFIAYFATPQLTGFKISMLAASVLTLGLNGSATVSETLRGGIEGVDSGQYDASRALALPYTTMMARIIIPQALRSVAPALVNEVITAPPRAARRSRTARSSRSSSWPSSTTSSSCVSRPLPACSRSDSTSTRKGDDPCGSPASRPVVRPVR